MGQLGIDKRMHALCKHLEVPHGLVGERKALSENMSCFTRLLTKFVPRCFEAYIKMNEFFERKPLDAKKIESL